MKYTRGSDSESDEDEYEYEEGIRYKRTRGRYSPGGDGDVEYMDNNQESKVTYINSVHT